MKILDFANGFHRAEECGIFNNPFYNKELVRVTHKFKKRDFTLKEYTKYDENPRKIEAADVDELTENIRQIEGK